MARAAIAAVKRELQAFKTPSKIKEHVAYLLGEGTPWLWGNMWNRPTVKGEVRPRQGRYQSAVIMETFAVHFSTFGIAMDPFEIDESESGWPIGALALAITAVERALKQWATGIWDTNGVFSSLHWAAVTNRYSTALSGKSMTSEKWWELLETAREHTAFKNSPDPFAEHGDDGDDDDVDPRTITLSSDI